MLKNTFILYYIKKMQYICSCIFMLKIITKCYQEMYRNGLHVSFCY